MSALDDLAAELGISSEQLRARLLSTEDEALQASYLTTDAQGRVSAQFSGHIQASGLDMIANQLLNNSPPPSSVIHWHKDSQTGAVVAELQGSGSSPADTPGLYVRSIAPDDAHTAQTFLEASYNNPGVDPMSGARVTLNKKTSAGPVNPDQTYVSAEAWHLNALHGADGAQVRVIGSDGASDFLQKPSFSQPGVAFSAARQPNTLHPVMVSLQIQCAGGPPSGVEIFLSANPPPGMTHLGYLQGTDANHWLWATWMVPAGWYYQVNTVNGGPGNAIFNEWVL